VQARLDRNPNKMRVRRQTVEHPFGTIKSWMGSTHSQMKTLEHVGTEMALHVLVEKYLNGRVGRDDAG
jgi:transposase